MKIFDRPCRGLAGAGLCRHAHEGSRHIGDAAVIHLAQNFQRTTPLLLITTWSPQRSPYVLHTALSEENLSIELQSTLPLPVTSVGSIGAKR